jgi:hypothetical protein
MPEGVISGPGRQMKENRQALFGVNDNLDHSCKRRERSELMYSREIVLEIGLMSCTSVVILRPSATFEVLFLTPDPSLNSALL